MGMGPEYGDPSAPPRARETMAREDPEIMAIAAQGRRLCLSIAQEGAVTDLDALQGHWTEAQYLRLTEHARRGIEFTDGRLDVLPMPTDRHQTILGFLFLSLLPVVRDGGGVVRFAPLRLRIREDKFREPDLLLFRDARDARRADDYWRGADWVAEVVSPDDPERDRVTKRLDYAEARIPEYWIVDPVDESVTVLVLEGGAYAEHGVFRRGQRARSGRLGDFSVSVAEVFDAA